ncbi:Cell cycle checkpoint control protein rad9b [Blyttiomyces sp. JEL0837]|nr:Cell cycle checkpoint control protein rad9b [Blyttiomyces sp. JEL0837]
MTEWLGFFSQKLEEVTFQCSKEWVYIRSFSEGNFDTGSETKRPLETELTVDVQEFDAYHVDEDADATFSLKDLKTVLNFAEAVGQPVLANFDAPGAPLILSVSQADLFTTDFVLATLSAAATQASQATRASVKAAATTKSQSEARVPPTPKAVPAPVPVTPEVPKSQHAIPQDRDFDAFDDPAFNDIPDEVMVQAELEASQPEIAVRPTSSRHRPSQPNDQLGMTPLFSPTHVPIDPQPIGNRKPTTPGTVIEASLPKTPIAQNTVSQRNVNFTIDSDVFPTPTNIVSTNQSPKNIVQQPATLPYQSQHRQQYQHPPLPPQQQQRRLSANLPKPTPKIKRQSEASIHSTILGATETNQSLDISRIPMSSMIPDINTMDYQYSGSMSSMPSTLELQERLHALKADSQSTQLMGDRLPVGPGREKAHEVHNSRRTTGVGVGVDVGDDVAPQEAFDSGSQGEVIPPSPPLVPVVSKFRFGRSAAALEQAHGLRQRELGGGLRGSDAEVSVKSNNNNGLSGRVGGMAGRSVPSSLALNDVGDGGTQRYSGGNSTGKVPSMESRSRMSLAPGAGAGGGSEHNGFLFASSMFGSNHFGHSVASITKPDLGNSMVEGTLGNHDANINNARFRTNPAREVNGNGKGGSGGDVNKLHPYAALGRPGVLVSPGYLSGKRDVRGGNEDETQIDPTPPLVKKRNMVVM